MNKLTNIKHTLIKKTNTNNTLATQPLINKIKPLALGLMVFAAPHAVSSESLANELVLDSGFELQVLADGAVANTSHTWALKTGTRSGLINPTGAQYADEAAHQNVAFVKARGKIAQNLGVSLGG